MTAHLLLGDEAIAQGAIDAGIAGAFSYPGTPSTEIFEYIHAHADGAGISALWSGNEKVAYEEALGMSYVGKRALVSMKHVGLNVASDPFMNSALTGVNGGMVVVVADDPGMHSSQNEQDTRYYAAFAQLPLFEPSNQQEAYDMTHEAFELSEKLGLPVLLRVVTRLAHSRAGVRTLALDERHDRDAPVKKPNPNDWTLVPVNARRRYAHLVALQPTLLAESEASSFNHLGLANGRGIICSGIAHNYVLEAVGTTSDYSILKVGQYPIPVDLVRQLVDHCSEIFVIEEGYPFIERNLTGLLGLAGKAVRGKLTGHLPPTGELTPDLVANLLGRPRLAPIAPVTDLAGRPPQLCRGCPHSDSFRALVEAAGAYDNPILFSDIGCYTLGVLPPFRAVHACVDMGASISMAIGASRAGHHPVLCTIGDSTFGHSGLTPLLGAAHYGANITVLILDNATTAMTGAQDSMTAGPRLRELLLGFGVDEEHVHVTAPLSRNHEANVELIRREIDYPGLSVIVPTRACIHVHPSKRVSA